MIKDEVKSLVIMPIAFASGHRSQARLVEPSRIEQNLQYSVVIRFGYVVRRFFVIGIGPILKQETGKLGMTCNARGSVDSSFVQRPRWSIDVLGPSRIRLGSVFEQGPR